MDTSLIEHTGPPILVTGPGGGMLESENDALDLVAACGEAGVWNLLVLPEVLPEAFYDLKTGLAGAVMLKLSNYRIRVALVVPEEKAAQGRFGEMALEANRSNREMHVFTEKERALEWLAGG